MSNYLLIQALNGLVIGVIYAVIAAGLTIIFSILKIVNFAHGEIYMMGGYFGYFVITLLGIPAIPAIAVAMLLAFALSVALERTLLTPLYSPTTERKGDYGILVTFGISIFLRNIAIILFGPFPLRPPSFFPGVLVIGDFVMTWDRVFAAGAGMALLVLLMVFLSRSAWGQALNAVSQSRESAAIVGINDRLVYTMAFGLGGAFAGAAGALVGPIYALTPSMGLQPDTPGLRDRDPGRPGLGRRQHHRRVDDRRVGKPVRRPVPRPEPRAELRPGVQPAGADGRAADPPHRPVRPGACGDGVVGCAPCGSLR